MWGRIRLIINTVRYLTGIQIKYQLWYRVKPKFLSLGRYDSYHTCSLYPVTGNTLDLIPCNGKYLGDLVFSFLNIQHTFTDQIDWNFQAYGKLWNYNLQYFDHLHDPSIDMSAKKEQVESFANCLLQGKVKPEPYPVSLRLLNWILFYSRTGYSSPVFDRSLKTQIDYLRNNLEFHIQANHLLENYIALLISGFALRDQPLIKLATNGLLAELKEQILPDGGHYEGSPMYHTIILSKLILLVYIAEENNLLPSQIDELKERTGRMLGWLRSFRFENDMLGNMNDAATDILPDCDTIRRAAVKANIEVIPVLLRESGYRKFNNTQIELLVDVGNIIPEYQPGHAHSDMMSFILYVNKKPIIVDVGTSTYDNNKRRHYERSTTAHNTVVVNEENQSEVWSSFRVGKRAFLSIEEEKPDFIRSSHNGYKKKYGVTHARSFFLNNTNGSVEIKDIIVSNRVLTNKIRSVAHFHLHESIDILHFDNTEIGLSNGLKIFFRNASSVIIKEYERAIGFNKLILSKKIEVDFTDELETSILCILK